MAGQGGTSAPLIFCMQVLGIKGAGGLVVVLFVLGGIFALEGGRGAL